MAERAPVLVVGAGLMGSQIGCEYSLGGHATTFLVRDVERSRARVSSAFAVAVEAGLAGTEAAAEAQRKMAFVETVASVDEATELVVESIPEEIGVKVSVLGDLARWLPNATIASNTSTIPLTELGAAIDAAERTVGTQYWSLRCRCRSSRSSRANERARRPSRR